MQAIQENQVAIQNLGNEMAVFRSEVPTKSEVASEFKAVRDELKSAYNSLRTDMVLEFNLVRTEMRDGFHRMRMMFETLLDKINTSLELNFQTLDNSQKIQSHNSRIGKLETELKLVKSALRKSEAD